MTYMAGQRGRMIDHDVCLVVQDVRDITHLILSEIRLRSRIRQASKGGL